MIVVVNTPFEKTKNGAAISPIMYVGIQHYLKAMNHARPLHTSKNILLIALTHYNIRFLYNYV